MAYNVDIGCNWSGYVANLYIADFTKGEKIMTDTILSVSNLNISLANGTNIINDVSFEIKSGEVVAIVGDNGAGKSTILKAIIREETEHKKISGNISYCGGNNILEMNDKEVQKFRAEVAYVPQKDEYNNIGKRITVFDVMMDSADLYSSKSYTKKEVELLFRVV